MTRLRSIAEHLDGPDRQWLLNALDAITEGEAPMVALELHSAARRAARDKLLCQVAAIDALTAWQAAGAISAWAQGRRAHGLSDAAVELCRSAEQSAPIPQSRKQCWNIVGREHVRADRDHEPGVEQHGHRTRFEGSDRRSVA